MKKHLFLIALAGFAFASCVKNEVATPESEGVKIGFASPVMYSNVNTKANFYGEISNNTYPEDESFKIFAVQHTGDLVSWANAAACEFNGQNISYDPNLGAWAPKNTVSGSYYYWPAGQLLSFAAVSPADLGLGESCQPEYSATGLEIENFVVNDSPAMQYDLLFSKRAVNMASSNMIDEEDYYSGIPIEFKHALTSINFAIKKDADILDEVLLKKIEVVNAKNKGSFSEKITDETVYASSPEWNVSTEASDVQDYVAFSGSVVFPTQHTSVSTLDAVNTYTLLLMPQELADNVELHITYTVAGTEFTKEVTLNTYPAASPIDEWLLGYRYTYRLIYGKASQKQDIIFFSPSVEGWEDGSSIDIIL